MHTMPCHLRSSHFSHINCYWCGASCDSIADSQTTAW